MRKKKQKILEVGDRVIERISIGRKKRIGEIIFVQDGRTRKPELMQLNAHDL